MLHAHQNALHTHHYPLHCLPQPSYAHNQQSQGRNGLVFVQKTFLWLVYIQGVRDWGSECTTAQRPDNLCLKWYLTITFYHPHSSGSLLHIWSCQAWCWRKHPSHWKSRWCHQDQGSLVGSTQDWECDGKDERVEHRILCELVERLLVYSSVF